MFKSFNGFKTKRGIKANAMSRRLGDSPDFPPFRRRDNGARETAGRNGGKSGLILTYKMRPDDARLERAKCPVNSVNSPFAFA